MRGEKVGDEEEVIRGLMDGREGGGERERGRGDGGRGSRTNGISRGGEMGGSAGDVMEGLDGPVRGRGWEWMNPEPEAGEEDQGGSWAAMDGVHAQTISEMPTVRVTGTAEAAGETEEEDVKPRHLQHHYHHHQGPDRNVMVKEERQEWDQGLSREERKEAKRKRKAEKEERKKAKRKRRSEG